MCDFPSAQLKKLRHQAAVEADKSSDDTFVRNSCAFVRAVDQLRLAHEELTGCGCWYVVAK